MTLQPPPPSRYSRALFFGISAIAITSIVIAARPVLLPFMLALVVAYVLMPAVRQVERSKMPRWAAILVVYAITIGVATGFGGAVIPRLFVETKSLSSELPRLTKRVRDHWLPRLDRRLQKWSGIDPHAMREAEEKARRIENQLEGGPPTPKADPGPPISVRPGKDGAFEIHLRDDLRLEQQSDGSWAIRTVTAKPKPKFSSARAFQDAFDKGLLYAQHNSLELIKLGQEIVAGVSRGVFYFFLTLMLAGYMMFTHERIHSFIREMWPVYRQPAFDRFLYRLDRGLSGVVRGQLLICLVNGILSAIGFWIFDLKYWPILSLIAGIMSIIPIFGSILSTIPAVAVGLTQGPGTAIGVLLWIVGIHQLEANFLNPKIIGDQAKIHPVLVVFALLFGEHYFHITGALLAVPSLALVQTLFLHFRESVLGLTIPGTTIPPPAPESGAVAVNIPKSPALPMHGDTGKAPDSGPSPQDETGGPKSAKNQSDS